MARKPVAAAILVVKLWTGVVVSQAWIIITIVTGTGPQSLRLDDFDGQMLARAGAKPSLLKASLLGAEVCQKILELSSTDSENNSLSRDSDQLPVFMRLALRGPGGQY